VNCDPTPERRSSPGLPRSYRIDYALYSLVSRLLSLAHANVTVESRWDEKAGLRRDAIRSQVIDALEAQEIKETGNEED
jgi:hypothetical protein